MKAMEAFETASKGGTVSSISVAAVGIASSAAAASGEGSPKDEEEAPTIIAMRDPTLSPYDKIRIEQFELERMIRQQQVREADKRLIRKNTPPPIQNSILLQGIIAGADGVNQAIINDDIVRVGDFVGKGSRKAKVIKITIDAVWFRYKRKKFSKSISQ